MPRPNYTPPDYSYSDQLILSAEGKLARLQETLDYELSRVERHSLAVQEIRKEIHAVETTLGQLKAHAPRPQR